ncbi:MAG TPA: TetR/AcrR family transcriptional regulator [Bacteroidales bacterium]|nr:TetR/AcrR family transcriptional regulator [Bacteroidales bacterium]
MKKELSVRQKEILESTVKLIGEGGIQALTIKNLSQKIGVTESAIYRHFKSRTEILETLLETIREHISVRYLMVAKSDKHVFERLEDMMIYQFEAFISNPSYAIVILSDGLYKNESCLCDKIFSIMEMARQTFIEVIRDGKKSGEIRNDIPDEQLAFVIMGSIRLMINQWSLGGFNFDLRKKGKELLNTIIILIKNN